MAGIIDLPLIDLDRTKGRFGMKFLPDGKCVIPDLAESLIPIVKSMGVGAESFWQEEPCAVTKAVLKQTRHTGTGHRFSELPYVSTDSLWHAHDLAMVSQNAGTTYLAVTGEATLLDIKIEISYRLMDECKLCERRCLIRRREGETGFCGLDSELQIGSYSMLYNEGPMVGAPTFSIFTRGCSLRCDFCYRPDDLVAKGRETMPPETLAMILDRAAESGAKSWHFLGGNPDESMPALLSALKLTQQSLPLAWNSALTLTMPAIELLKGIVDIWIPDFKFGNDDCAKRVSGFENYTSLILRNLSHLRDQNHVVVRHMEQIGHESCCSKFVQKQVHEMPNFLLHQYPCIKENKNNH